MRLELLFPWEARCFANESQDCCVVTLGESSGGIGPDEEGRSPLRVPALRPRKVRVRHVVVYPDQGTRALAALLDQRPFVPADSYAGPSDGAVQPDTVEVQVRPVGGDLCSGRWAANAKAGQSGCRSGVAPL